MLALLALLAVRWLMQPGNLVPLLLAQAERALGLEIQARGASDYRLRGTPQLVLRDVTARASGAAPPLLEADRVLVSVPWSTLLARGRDTTATRLELDAPVLHIEELQRWLASRPPSDAPTPTLTRGIGISNGSVLGGAWSLHEVHADVPELDASKPLRAKLRGRYKGNGLVAPFNVALAMKRPAMDSALGLAGEVRPVAEGWQSRASFRLSGILRSQPRLQLERAVLGTHVQYAVDGQPSLRFALGIAGAATVAPEALEIRPLALAMRGQGAIPQLDARGELSIGEILELRLQGQVARWPDAWPALPPPLGRATTPIPFQLRYAGPNDLSGIASLQVQQDATDLDARFRLRQITAWMDAGDVGSPLPPMTGTFATSRLEISGAVLEGVQVQLQDPDLEQGEPVR